MTLTPKEKKIVKNVLKSTVNIIKSTESSHKIKSLFSGELGVAFFLATLEYNELENDTGGVEKIYSILNDSRPVSNSICNGNAGSLWLLSKSNGKLFSIDDKLIDFLKNFCLNSFVDNIDSGHFDYLHGAFGILHAMLLSNTLNEDELKKIESTLILNFGGESFPTEYNPSKREGLNLHLAHGISAFVIVLSELYSLTKNPEIATIIKSHLQVLQRNYRENSLSCFPFMDGGTAFNIRNAWCYGDMGIGSAYYQAGLALNDTALLSFATKIWESTARRTSKKIIKMYDSPICHGVFGNLLYYDKINNYLGGNKIIEESIHFYLEKVGQYFEKYKDDFLKCREGDDYEYHRSLLSGVAGIGLVCMRLLNYETFEWEKTLLI